MNVAKSMLVAAVAIATSVSGASTLQGANVTGALYCCVAPTEAYRISSVENATVGNQIEFPINTFTFLSDGTSWDEGSIDVGTTTLRLDLFSAGTTRPGTFNGFVFSFSGAPTIVGVSVNSSSSLVPTSVSFSQDTILIHVDSLPYSVGDFFLLDVTLAAVPELPISVLLAAGVLALAAQRQALRRHRDA